MLEQAIPPTVSTKILWNTLQPFAMKMAVVRIFVELGNG